MPRIDRNTVEANLEVANNRQARTEGEVVFGGVVVAQAALKLVSMRGGVATILFQGREVNMVSGDELVVHMRMNVSPEG